jgi:hypothetical protein
MWHESAHSMNFPQRFAGAIALSVPVRFAGYMPSNALNEGAFTVPSHRQWHCTAGSSIHEPYLLFKTTLPVSANDGPAQREGDSAPFESADRKAKGVTQPFCGTVGKILPGKRCQEAHPFQRASSVVKTIRPSNYPDHPMKQGKDIFLPGFLATRHSRPGRSLCQRKAKQSGGP